MTARMHRVQSLKEITSNLPLRWLVLCHTKV